MTDPVIVVGTGRCGSSFVSGILHNDLGVLMGDRFRKPDPLRNPDGYYEDLDFVDLNRDLLFNYMTFGGWMIKIQDLISKRLSMDKPWGFKDPQVSELMGLYLGFFNKPKIIWCQRSFRAVLDSFVTKNRWTETDARHIISARFTCLKRLLESRDRLDIVFKQDERKTKEEIISVITSKWPTWDSVS